MITRSPQAASPEQLARLQELRDQLAEETKKTREGRRAARQSMQEAGAAAASVDSPYFGKGMFAQNSKLSGLLKAGGPGAAVVASTLASVGGQFIPEKNKQARAAVSGLSDVAQYAGTGAVFGAPGAAIGAIVGLGFALKKFSDAKAEEAVDKINDSLDKTKEKAAEFSGAAQNYSTSLESLQNALNDPKSRPETLLKFQNNKWRINKNTK
jgi:gas vesicle protein